MRDAAGTFVSAFNDKPVVPGATRCRVPQTRVGLA